MVTKAEYKVIEMKWDKELSVADAAIIFMDACKISN
jgi:hypothetical protein